MESRGKLILLMVAGVLVAFGAIAVYSRLSPPEPKPIEVEAPKASNRVIIARRELSPGTLVQIGPDIDWQEVPPETIKEDYLREGNIRIEDFNGAVARRQLHAGEPLTATAITRAGEGGFMSAVLNPGMRAVSVAVTATSGNAGFISPGDHVDLIVIRHVPGDKGPDSAVSETFVHDVRVVAVDQMLDNPENKAILAKTVTVEVTPKQAEQIAVAAEMGKINIALRSLSEDEKNTAADKAAPVVIEEPQDPAAEKLTDLYGNQVRETSGSRSSQSLAPRIRVFRGGEVENIELY